MTVLGVAVPAHAALKPPTESSTMTPRLTATLDFHAQALTLRAERQRVIAGNIANADTPGYQARDFSFADAMRDATRADGSTLGGKATPTLRYAVPSQTALDSNSVDMDRERAAFVDNAVKYESTLRFANGHVRTMLDAMKSPSQG
jgi:flagellar basal-body rod protein FlgB